MPIYTGPAGTPGPLEDIVLPNVVPGERELGERTGEVEIPPAEANSGLQPQTQNNPAGTLPPDRLSAMQ